MLGEIQFLGEFDSEEFNAPAGLNMHLFYAQKFLFIRSWTISFVLDNDAFCILLGLVSLAVGTFSTKDVFTIFKKGNFIDNFFLALCLWFYCAWSVRII